MMMRHSSRPSHGCSRQSGFTLLNVLVASLIFGFGVLGLVRSFANVTSAATQNTNISALASLSNGFGAVLQANSGLLVNASFVNTYTQSNYATAPAALQPWLQQATALPNAQVQIATGPDSASGAACAQYTGCTVTMVITWTQVGTTPNRTQTFLYHLGQ